MEVCSELKEEREAEKQIGIVTSPSGQRRTWQRVDNQRLSGVNGNKLWRNNHKCFNDLITGYDNLEEDANQEEEMEEEYYEEEAEENDAEEEE